MTATEERGEFERLYIRWRFGDLGAGAEAVRLGRLLTASALPDHERGSLFLKLGLLLKAWDPQGAEAAIDQARVLGAPIPRNVARGDESQAPVGEAISVDRHVVSGPSTRRFEPPLGDVWHPSYDLAATHLPPLELSVIEGGWLSVDVSGGLPQVYAFTSDQRLVADLSTGAEPFLAEPIDCAGPLVLLDDSFSGFNVSHCLFDKFPRLAAYEAYFPGQPLAGLMFSDALYYRDALNWFGHRLLAPAGSRWTVRADQLALLSNHRRGEVMHPAFSASDLALGFIRQHLQAPSLGVRRLYVSRQDAAVRRLANELEVATLFTEFGFEVVELAGLDFEAQGQLFNQAGAIAGVHGAGLANLVFAAPGTRVFEIMPPLSGTFAYWVMAQRLGQTYQLFTAEDAEFPVRPGASYDPSLGSRPIRVDLARLKSALQDFLG